MQSQFSSVDTTLLYVLPFGVIKSRKIKQGKLTVLFLISGLHGVVSRKLSYYYRSVYQSTFRVWFYKGAWSAKSRVFLSWSIYNHRWQLVVSYIENVIEFRVFFKVWLLMLICDFVINVGKRYICVELKSGFIGC